MFIIAKIGLHFIILQNGRKRQEKIETKDISIIKIAKIFLHLKKKFAILEQKSIFQNFLAKKCTSQLNRHFILIQDDFYFTFSKMQIRLWPILERLEQLEPRLFELVFLKIRVHYFHQLHFDCQSGNTIKWILKANKSKMYLPAKETAKSWKTKNPVRRRSSFLAIFHIAATKQINHANLGSIARVTVLRSSTLANFQIVTRSSNFLKVKESITIQRYTMTWSSLASFRVVPRASTVLRVG